jgi:hypothetical protein
MVVQRRDIAAGNRHLRDATALPVVREAAMLSILNTFIKLGVTPAKAVEMTALIKDLHALNGSEAKIARLIVDAVNELAAASNEERPAADPGAPAIGVSALSSPFRHL